MLSDREVAIKRSEQDLLQSGLLLCKREGLALTAMTAYLSLCLANMRTLKGH
jgi:hypothetical protein